MKSTFSAIAAVLMLGFSTAGLTAQGTEEDTIFTSFCAACHQAQPGAKGSPNERAPTRDTLKSFTAEAVYNALVNGKMQVQGTTLNDAQKRLVSEYATGKRIDPKVLALGPVVVVNRCSVEEPMRDPANGPSWNGFGNGVAGNRFQPAGAGGLTAADLPRLKLKWAFGYANVSAARAQPTLAGGRLFVASENSEVHALNPKTGCTYWSFKAAAGVRSALSVGPYQDPKGKKGYAVYFGDGRANAYAVDAQSGVLLWTRRVDEHPAAAITGAPTVHAGRVFVPVQGLNEEGRGGRDGYSCCSFRGSLSALDASTGQVLWKTYTIDESKPRGVSKTGVQMYGPAGGSIWSSPSVDAKRHLVYAATGNAYADPAQKMTNAVVAFDEHSGAVKWFKQLLPADNWAMGCEAKNPDNPACPETLGPDFDFSATPAVVKVGHRDLIILPQKSAIAYALDPDKRGELVWQFKFGEGSGLGGQWGGAYDAKQAYFGLADFLTEHPGGMNAVNLSDGKPVWHMPPQPMLCGEKRPGCGPGQGGALTAIPGAVLNGALDGGLRAYSTTDGKVLWMFDTGKEFATVNGVKAKGGSMDGNGPIVAGGMVYVNSGYGGLVGTPGNVLLAFGPE
jgi:polyvinyl alcohol dehydrogenase (cytochrome)